MKRIYLIKFIFLCIFALFLIIAAFFSCIHFENKELEISFIDVGQGDCAYIKTPGGFRVLIDSGDIGSYDNKIKGFLAKRGVKTIDAAVITHFHSDHSSGIYEMIGNKRIDQIYIPKTNNYNLISEKLFDKAEEYSVNISSLTAKDIIYDGSDGVKLYVLYPDKTLYLNEEKEENNDSLVLMLEYKGIKVLFTGDLEKEPERFLALCEDVDADILKVSHHGSKTATSDYFLSKVTPQFFVISCGLNNKYNFPDAEVLEKIDKSNSKVFRTDFDGDITFTISDKSEISVNTTRKGK